MLSNEIQRRDTYMHTVGAMVVGKLLRDKAVGPCDRILDSEAACVDSPI